MAQKLNPVAIHVEGRNDLFALVNLLIRHGIDYDQKPWPETFPHFSAAISDSDDPTREAAGVEAVLQAMVDEVIAQAGRTVGFVLDADDDLLSRWQSIQTRLAAAQVTTLDTPSLPIEHANLPSEGFLGISQKYRTRVGVWIMPNNGGAGALEDFLRPLIPASSQHLFEHAVKSTDDAKAKLAEQEQEAFPETHVLKAQLACWLAWQKNPGRPYGTAIRAKYFDCDSDSVQKFVSWFMTLFGITL